MKFNCSRLVLLGEILLVIREHTHSWMRSIPWINWRAAPSINSESVLGIINAMASSLSISKWRQNALLLHPQLSKSPLSVAAKSDSTGICKKAWLQFKVLESLSKQKMETTRMLAPANSRASTLIVHVVLDSLSLPKLLSSWKRETWLRHMLTLNQNTENQRLVNPRKIFDSLNNQT